MLNINVWSTVTYLSAFDRHHLTTASKQQVFRSLPPKLSSTAA